MTISIKDEGIAGNVINEIDLDFADETVTVADIITARVTREVEEYNRRADSRFYGLVQPTAAEQILNGFKLKKQQVIDAEKQVYVALSAFQNNAYFLLIDNVQSESLQQKVRLRPDTTVSFIKLTPLVGG